MQKMTVEDAREYANQIAKCMQEGLKNSLPIYLEYKNKGGSDAALIRAGINYVIIKDLAALSDNKLFLELALLPRYLSNALMELSQEDQEMLLVAGVYSASKDAVVHLKELRPLEVKIIFDGAHIRDEAEQRAKMAEIGPKAVPPYTIEGGRIIFNRKCEFNIKDLFKILSEYIWSKLE